jgi:hypothetical protein
MMTIEIPLDELGQIEDNYRRGRYAHLADCLRQFLINHSADIFKFREEHEKREGKELQLDGIIGLYILDNKTVDFNLDMRDQWSEIMKEKWIRHERNNREPASEIEKDWVRKYAEGWRTHRTREIMYVFWQNKEAYLELVK